MIGTIIAAFGGLALLGVGIGALVAPAFSSSQYGLPTTERLALALIRAIGARDIVLGTLVLVLLAQGDRGALALVLLVSIIAALADACAVATGRSAAPPRTYVVHIGGGIAFLAAYALVRIGW